LTDKLYMYDEKSGYEVVGEMCARNNRNSDKKATKPTTGNKLSKAEFLARMAKGKKKKVTDQVSKDAQTEETDGESSKGKNFQKPGKYTAEDRKKIPIKDFGDPIGRKFPIVTQKDVDDAATLVGKASDPEAVKANIIKIANRKGFNLPDAWQKEIDDSSKKDKKDAKSKK
jgi:hypothetical protein